MDAPLTETVIAPEVVAAIAAHAASTTPGVVRLEASVSGLLAGLGRSALQRFAGITPAATTGTTATVSGQAARLRVEVAGATLVDTDDTVIVFETALEPRLYVDPAHVRTDLLRQSNTSTYCNYKGPATYWSAVLGETVVEDVAWSYQDPLPESSPIRGFFSFDADRADVVAELPGQDRGGE